MGQLRRATEHLLHINAQGRPVLAARLEHPRHHRREVHPPARIAACRRLHRDDGADAERPRLAHQVHQQGLNLPRHRGHHVGGNDHEQRHRPARLLDILLTGAAVGVGDYLLPPLSLGVNGLDRLQNALVAGLAVAASGGHKHVGQDGQVGGEPVAFSVNDAELHPLRAVPEREAQKPAAQQIVLPRARSGIQANVQGVAAQVEPLEALRRIPQRHRERRVGLGRVRQSHIREPPRDAVEDRSLLPGRGIDRHHLDFAFLGHLAFHPLPLPLIH